MALTWAPVFRPSSAEQVEEVTLTSAIDSWLGVRMAEPPQVRLLVLVPSIVKLLPLGRWPFALTCATFSVAKVEFVEEPGQNVLTKFCDSPVPFRAPSPKTPGANLNNS